MGGFERRIQRALRGVLVDPEFLFRIEIKPDGIAPGTAYQVTDVELASRLSFFLWSSLPDDALLDLASREELAEPDVLRGEVRRMLADPKSRALIDNFAGQWLYLRNLPGIAPDPDAFPEFDDNLREAFRRETELFVESQLRDDRSVVDLLSADYAFVNERLARHYGIPGVLGNRFRRVTLDDGRRGGLLGQGSILTTTSYPNRTSPTLRGKWVLENLLGAPPPPPPANVPDLADSDGANPTTVRVRLEAHRANPICASCHAQMDPIGLALEPFDALGKWRTHDGNDEIDPFASLPDVHRTGRGARASAGSQRALRDGFYREASDIRAGTGARRVRCAGRSTDRPDSGCGRAPVVVHRHGDSRKCAVPDEEIARAMIITKKHLPRRTFLRGIGATVALPLLDGMVPALTALRATAAQPVRRFGIVYVPNGILMDRWTPPGEGTGLELTPILEPLAAYRDDMILLTGLSNKQGDAWPGEGAGDHARAAAAYLTGVHPKKTEGADIRAGVSVDQIAARVLGQETQLSSLELSLESREAVGSCDPGYSCAYANTLSWRSPTTPLPMENNPRVVFERLFGGNEITDPEAWRARREEDRNILDAVGDKVARLQGKLGQRDQLKLEEYLEAIRDIERRIQMAEAQSERELPVMEQPPGIPSTFEEHAKVMYDLQVLAYQADLTRVITFMVGHETSQRAYPEIGVPDAHHPLSHHGGDADKIEKLIKVNEYHARMFEYYVTRLSETRDGDSSLLDQSMIIYGSGMSDGNGHNHHNLPTLLVGKGAGSLKGGRHLRYAPETPVTNLFLTVLDKLGVPAETLGDSSGRMQQLSSV